MAAPLFRPVSCLDRGDRRGEMAARSSVPSMGEAVGECAVECIPRAGRVHHVNSVGLPSPSTRRVRPHPAVGSQRDHRRGRPEVVKLVQGGVEIAFAAHLDREMPGRDGDVYPLKKVRVSRAGHEVRNDRDRSSRAAFAAARASSGYTSSISRTCALANVRQRDRRLASAQP